MSTVYKVKEFTVRTSLLALGVCFELLSKHCPEMQNEIADWEEGRVLSLGVLPDGPSMAVRKEGGALKYLGRGHHDSPLRIYFKNVDSALITLLGLIGAHTAFAEHRAIVHGSLYQAMEANRAMVIVVKYLLPGLAVNRISKRVPKMSGSELLLKARIMATLTPALIVNFAK